MQRQNIRKSKSRVESICFYAAVIFIWQCIFWLGTTIFGFWKPYAFPSPAGVIQTFGRLLKDGSIVMAMLQSIKRCLLGFGISLLFGGVTGILITHFPLMRRNLKPLMMGIQTLPSICWVPFAILWFGLNESAIYFVVVMGSIFSVSLAIEDAFTQIPPIYTKAARTMGTNKKQMYRYVLFPAALPGIVSGMKQSWSFAWRALMSAEVMSSYVGLGYALITGRDMADINQVMAVMIVIVIIGILIEKFVFGNIERHLKKKRGL